MCPHQFRGRIYSPTIICSYQICLVALTTLHLAAHCHWGGGGVALLGYVIDIIYYLCDLEEVSRSLPSAPGPHRSDSNPFVDLRSSQSVGLTT